ncbi:hypothetical protein DNU06_16815 [Putridiphycobacter roseus]|uniref:Carboxypeptidase regulatory-like domain-containing protein n=1 Tax=Putridiphycobacter roseus TaxID=2219161 RepID=A0A2W1NLR3_9FLAO|nr:hypothetical protein [Putridiphycobacter roseus]PZE15668.1 hypothetical protein DNU06_16815 [Putridiphycobacter roseus]
MKQIPVHAFIFLLFLCSCVALRSESQDIFGEVKINDFGGDTLPVVANLKLYDKDFYLVSEIDSTLNGSYRFQLNKAQKYYFVISDVKVQVEKVPDFLPQGLWSCINVPDTIVVNTTGNVPIIIKTCEVNVTPGLPSNDGGFIYEKQD